MIIQRRTMMVLASIIAMMTSFYGFINGSELQAQVFTDRSMPGSDRGNVDRTFSPKEVEIAPQALNYEEVREFVGYPEEARNAGIQGKVVLRVLVDEKGNYMRHEVVDSFHPLLRIPCEVFVPFMRFRPALRQGDLVSCWVTVPFEFQLPQYGK